MKFKFINKAKDLNPADIQVKMNFGKLAQSAKALSSAKLSAGILKLGTSTVTTVLTTSAVVVTAVTIGGTNPEIFKSRVIEGHPATEELVEQPESRQIEEQPTLMVQEPEEKTPVIEVELEQETKEVVETPEAIIEQVDSIMNVEIHNSASENIFISSTPLPSEDAFFAFIERELNILWSI